MNKMNLETLNKAIEYSEKGLSVHLLKEAEKRPVNAGWSKAPFMKKDDLINGFKLENDANIGIRLGECTKLGTRYLYAFDLDISSKDENKVKEAHAMMKSIFSDYDKLPSVRSASPNSRHFYFLSREVLKTKKLAHSSDKVIVSVNGEKKQKNAWEIDLCSTGKQVVLPPSKFNGRVYMWDKDLLEFLSSEELKKSMIIDDVSLISLYKDEEETVKEVKKPMETKKHNIEEVRKSLDRLPEQFYENYDEWLKVGMALHNEFDNTEDEQDAIALYDEFSKKSGKYQKGAAYSKWKSFNRDDGGVSLGTIFFHCPKTEPEDNIKSFEAFLNAGNITFSKLGSKMKDIRLEDHEIEMFIKRISEELSTTMGSDYTVAATRKLIKTIRAKIKEEEEEALEKLAIGIDDTLATLVLKENFNDGKHILNLNENIFCYKKGVWKVDEKAVLDKLVLETIKKIMNSDDLEHALIKKVIYSKKKNDNINSLTENISSLILKMSATSESEDILNLRSTRQNNCSIINTLNKEIYINNGQITVEDHRYDSYLIGQFDVEYDEIAECPTWLNMLNNVFQKYPDKREVVRHFCEILGYILQSRKKDPVFMILLGSGKNGKSFVMSEFSKIMGIESTVNDSISGFFKSSHATTGLLGKNMFIDDEYEKGSLLPDGQIKKLSENKVITAEPKNKGKFNFISKCTPVILSNSTPKTKDSSDGMERRAHIFDFNYVFSDDEIDRRLDEKLAAEKSGFLNHLLKSYIEYEKRGRFDVPVSCRKSLKSWLKGSNPVNAFFEEKVEVTENYEDVVKAQTLFDMYKNYSINENDGQHTFTRNSFYEELKGKRGVNVVMNSTDRNYYIHGVRVKNIFNS